MERRLSAIFTADMVGYSRLMEADETGTIQRQKTHRKELIDPAFEKFNGRIVKEMGDGILVEFPSVVGAVSCALVIQRAMPKREAQVDENRRIAYRVGINLGDVIAEGGDLLGDGVNVAARLEQLSEPGGICISGTAFDQIDGKSGFYCSFLGEQQLKNISRPVRVYGVSVAVPDTTGSRRSSSVAVEVADRTKPSIAVLPFQNLSGDTEQEYFSDGITEDIIAALARYRWLRVTARNAAFGLKNRDADARQVGQELGVGYLVEGSVRRAGNRIRVAVHLIDTETGNHLWVDRFDRDLEDIFEVQDTVTETIAARIEPEIGAAERRRVIKSVRPDLRAWDCYHLGVWHFFKFTAEDNIKAQELFQMSRELDPEFGEAHAWWAYSVILGMVYWDTEPSQDLLKEALAATDRALEIDDRNAVFYALKARVQLARCEYESAIAENEIAISLNPTFAAAHCGLGDSLAYEGRYDEALGRFEKAIDLSPNDPQRWAFLTYGALALIFRGDYEKAVEWADKAREIPNCQYWTIAHKTVALALLGREEETKRAAAELLAKRPDFTIGFARKKLFYLRRPEHLKLYTDALKRAGIPE